MADLVTFGEGLLRLSPPDEERLEAARQFEVRTAGSAAGTAIAAERLGAVTTVMTKLPDGPIGRRVHNGLLEMGIDVEAVWGEEGRVGTYYIEHAGAPRGVNVVYDLEGSAFSTVSARRFDVDVVRNARGFFVTGISPALSDATREATANLLGAARKAGTTTALDFNYRSELWSAAEARETLTQLFPAVDVLVVAARDAQRVLGHGGEEPAQIAHQIAADYEFTTVVVTRGELGAIAWHDSVVHSHDGYETETTDPVGAGDAFSGAFVARRLAGDDIREALDYANAAAALKRTIPGDFAPITRAEVEAVIAGENDDISR
ncbi:2-keto-3-deoxygluconate kinase [Halobacteriales archaeon QS_8_69_26]|nr:MAG: 2-keto-3-deoxygluconate kinase [Halobacteriales archaeon QS_8_69_26]